MRSGFFNSAMRNFLSIAMIGWVFFLSGCGKITGSALAQDIESGSQDPGAGRPLEHGSGRDGKSNWQQDSYIKFEHLSIEHGLSQNSVLSILQDRDGFLWFGTIDGLNKYDGVRFTVYKHDPFDAKSISDNTILALYEDSAGDIWIGTDDGGLNRLDHKTGEFSHYQYDPEDRNSLSDNTVLSIIEDRFGDLWVGTMDGGLNRFNRQTNSFVRYLSDPGNLHSVSGNTIHVIYEDSSGLLWVGASEGLSSFDRETGIFTRYVHDDTDPSSLSHHSVTSILEDKAGNLWFATDGGGLNRYVKENQLFIHYRHSDRNPASLADDRIKRLFEDRLGRLWVGTVSAGLDLFDREAVRFIHYHYKPGDHGSLSANDIESIYEDRSGVLWVGTRAGGLNKVQVHSSGFVHFREDPGNPHGLSGRDVWTVLKDRYGYLWVGIYGGGLNRINLNTGKNTIYTHDPANPYSLSDNAVVSLFEDRNGTLWVGTDGGGLSLFDRKSEGFYHYRQTLGEPYSLSSDYVSVVFEDSNGILWVGTSGGGLNRMNQERAQVDYYRYRSSDPTSLSHNAVREIYEDRSGNLWIGTEKGLNRLDPRTGLFQRYLHDAENMNSLGDNSILVIHEDANGILWIGTNGGGLDRFDPFQETFTHYREADGLPNNVVYGILEDRDGMLWLSTNMGLTRFDPKTERFKNFDVQDGLQGNKFNANACFQDDQGRMYFGGENGLTAFSPEEIRDNPYLPPIVLTALLQEGQNILSSSDDGTSDITLRWPKNEFEFEYAALSYWQSDDNQYAYMLDGYDLDWNYVGTAHAGRYTNLSGGNYTLRIKGANNDGVWNEVGTAVHITVIPPVWETWWFQGAVIFLVLSSVAAVYRWRVSNIQTRNQELEILVRERTRDLEQRTGELARRTYQLQEKTVEIERRRQELEALYQADEQMHRHLLLDDVLKALVEVAVDLLMADKSAVIVWDEEQDRLVTQVAYGFKPDSVAQLTFLKDEGVTGLVMTKGKPVVVEDIQKDECSSSEQPEIMDVVLKEGVCSLIHLPIKIGNEVFGVFNVSFTKPHAFGPEEVRMFTALAQRAGLAIENAHLYEQSNELAVFEERNRLASDLHDSVKQKAFAASAQIGAVRVRWQQNSPEAQNHLEEAERLIYEIRQELTDLIHELHPEVLNARDLPAAVREFVYDWAQRSEVEAEVEVILHNDKILSSEVAEGLFRIMQGALSNIARHSQATQTEVSLLGNEDEVSLIIRDNGRGFILDKKRSGLGLRLMRERAERLKGTLEIDSSIGQGTQIRVTCPCDSRIRRRL